MPGRDGTGPLGKGQAKYCVCPKCGEQIAHATGTPCTSMKCPKCGSAMIRGS